MKSYTIPKKFEAALEKIEKRSNKSVDYHIKRALSQYVEDAYDVIQAQEHLKHNAKTYSIEDMKKELGLNPS